MSKASTDCVDLAPVSNPVRTRDDWERMRAAVLADPGAFHGDIAPASIAACP